MSQFTYEGLDWAKYETRFLRFLETADRRNGPLSFEMVHAPISKAPVYWALSYCWGVATDLALVEIDGCQVSIRRSLADALMHCGLRAGDHIWADALCINQNDIPEKNYQLGFMGQVYARATCTIIWLGNASRYTEVAAAYLKICQEVAFYNDYQSSSTDERRTYARESSPHGTTSLGLSPGADHRSRQQSATFDRYHASRKYIFQEAMRKVEYVEEAREGVLELLARDYWERVWVIQEIAKCRDAMVKCGDQSFDLEMLFLAADTLSEVPSRTKSHLNAIRSFRMQIQGDKPYHARFSLLTAIMRTRFSLSTDPRDKIFALLGITKDGSELIPNPSYAESETEIIYDLSRTILTSLRPNNGLPIARHSIAQGQKSLPLWVIAPNALQRLPPWVVDFARGDSQNLDWTFDARSSALRTHTIQLAMAYSGLGPDLNASRETAEYIYQSTPEERSRMAEDYLTALLERLTNGVGAFPQLGEDRALRDAFARMIRDAGKGFTTYGSQYDLDSCRSTLKDIGAIHIQGQPLSQWAFTCISRRHMQVREQSPLGALTPEVNRSQPHNTIKIPTSAFRLIQDALEGLLCYADHRLKLAVYNQTQPVIISTRTRLLDYAIFQVDQCHLPLVLERDPRSGQYIVTGEACFGKNYDGTWWSARQALHQLKPVDAHSQRITINLDPV